MSRHEACAICKEDYDVCPHTQLDLADYKERQVASKETKKLRDLIRKIVKEELKNEIGKLSLPASYC